MTPLAATLIREIALVAVRQATTAATTNAASGPALARAAQALKVVATGAGVTAAGVSLGPVVLAFGAGAAVGAGALYLVTRRRTPRPTSPGTPTAAATGA